MASFDFNPITGQLDLVGSGGASYIDGVVADPTALPVTVGTPALDSVYLAKAGSGVWLINRRPAGLYCRTANNGVAADWTYLGAFPEVNADGNWELYNSTDPTKELKFDLSGLPTATVRTVSAPADNGQMLVEGQPIGNTTPNSGAFTTLSANNGTQSTVAPALSAETTWNDEAVFVANTSGGTMTVTSMISGTIQVGQEITAGDLIGTVITGLGTGTGGTGTYTITSNSTRTGITFTTKQRLTAFSVNATDTSSGSYSRIADFQTDGISRFAVLKSGDINLRGTSTQRLFTSGSEYRFAIHGASDINNFTDVARFINGNIFVPVGFGIGNNAVTGVDVLLTRDAAGTLAQRNGTNAQTFNIYNTSSSGNANHERGFMRWSSNVLQIGTEAGGTGSARALELTASSNISIKASATNYQFLNNGEFVSAGSVVAAANSPFRFASNRTRISCSADGLLLLSNNVVNGFDRLQFGGTTSSFPAIKRNSTTLEARLADDSAFAPLSCGALTLNGNLDASTKDIVTDTTTGTKIGTGTTQKIGFFNATPVVQQAAIADATDAATTQARLNDLLAAMRSLGLIAT